MLTRGGILVGGAGSRMGGAAKGLLPAPSGEPIVARMRQILADLEVSCVLVGRRAEYAGLGLEMLDDDPPGIGPLGGLCALLRHAQGGYAIAVACDMPFVTRALVARLLAAPPSIAVAARTAGGWEPMLARYDAARALPIAERRAREGRASLRDLLDELGAERLELSVAEARALVDWDSPEDRRKEAR
jgi:molybdenum cofactor guanylyltransferase